MNKTQGFRVQSLTWTKLETVTHELAVLTEVRSFQYLITAVDIVIEQNVPDVFHMYPYLVRAAGLKITLNMRSSTR